MKQAGAELGQAQHELGLRLNWDLFEPCKLIIELELGLNYVLGSTHVAQQLLLSEGSSFITSLFFHRGLAGQRAGRLLVGDFDYDSKIFEQEDS